MSAPGERWRSVARSNSGEDYPRRFAEHFARLGKEEFLFFDKPSANVEELSLLGLEFISDGMRFIASKQVVPAWLSYLKNVLSLRATAAGGSRA